MSHTCIATEIAQAAARLVVEEGMDWSAAKHRAVRMLGLPPRTPLPDHATLEDAVREHIALFCADTQPAELRALRELALVWMQRLSEFRPHLAAAVWRGTATRLSDIHLHLFCDDPKSAEIALINHGVHYDVTPVPDTRNPAKARVGATVDALSLQSHCPGLGETVGVHLLIYDFDDLRGALQPDSQGRTWRGDEAALRALLAHTPSAPAPQGPLA